MFAFRRAIAVLVLALAAFVLAAPASAQPRPSPDQVLHNWYRMILELVRHTPTYSPPVASRSFAYVGVTGFEVVAEGSDELVSLAGQLHGLEAPPARAAGEQYDEAVMLQAALALSVRNFFGNTGPTGQRAMDAMEARLSGMVTAGLPEELVARSEEHGRAVARHIFDWSKGDGGAVVENLGFPYRYELTAGAAHWVPTSRIALQQAPLLPAWGENRTFAMPHGAACPLPPPPAYSEDPDSEFYREALEVYETAEALSEEQYAIARFWADDPMLSPTPPGHWISIAMQILEREEADVERRVDILARLGVTLADAFIGCWQAKYEFDLLRPVTYINRHIDPDWQPALITPPFPEYPSGHSTQSAAAAEVLSAFFGHPFAFEDDTHRTDGLAARSYPDFRAAAEEAALSRLYGGIHFRAAIERGLEQGRCIGAHANALRTRR